MAAAMPLLAGHDQKIPQRDHEHATRQATLQREVGDSNARGRGETGAGKKKGPQVWLAGRSPYPLSMRMWVLSQDVR